MPTWDFRQSMRPFGNIGAGLLDLLLPPRCHICRTVLHDPGLLHICATCYADLPVIGSPLCSICGIPFDGSGDDHPCGSCLASPPPYQAARAALRYEGACRDLLHAFKYQQRSHLRRPLGLLTAELLTPFAMAWQPDLLIPVPLHRKRLQKRGFNQAVLLAELLSRQWQVPLLRQGLARTRLTIPQVELDRAQRCTNLKGVFAVPYPAAVNGKRVMLIDDVFTTGSTLAESARTLLAAGCSSVTAVTVAHAP